MTVAPAGRRQNSREGRMVERTIDCDIHTNLSSLATLTKYMSRRWCDHLQAYGLRRPGEVGNFSTRPRAFAARTDSVPPSGGPPGSDLDFTREQLLDAWDIEYAVVNPIAQALVGGEPGEYGAALISAVNDWTLAEWLDPEPRLLGSICVPVEEPALAVREIRRLADNPRFVQVLINLRTREPIGNRRYWPIFEEACAHGLPIAAHVGGPSVNPYTVAGQPSYYFEYHAGYPQGAHSQLTSLVIEGAFEAFPPMKYVLQEAAFAWIAPLMWRLDRSWRQLRSEVPHLKHEPSHYLREHVYITTQPIEEPERASQFTEILEDLQMDDRLLFATDYPHLDFDAPDRAIPRTVQPETRAKIMAGNARRLYNLPEPTHGGDE
jgi:uncharacterized protein